MLAIHDVVRLDLGLPEDAPLAVLNPKDPERRRHRTEVREAAVRRDQLQRHHIGRTDEDRRHSRNPRRDSEVCRFSDHGVLAELESHFDGDGVARFVKPLPHRHLAFELAVVILGLPGRLIGDVDIHGGIFEDRRPGNPSANRRGIDERLEGRAGLALRLGNPVPLAVLEVASAHHRADVARPGFQRHHQPLQIRGEGSVVGLGAGLRPLIEILPVGQMVVRSQRLVLDGGELRFQRPFGRLLHIEIEGREHPEARSI